MPDANLKTNSLLVEVIGLGISDPPLLAINGALSSFPSQTLRECLLLYLDTITKGEVKYFNI